MSDKTEAALAKTETAFAAAFARAFRERSAAVQSEADKGVVTSTKQIDDGHEVTYTTRTPESVLAGRTAYALGQIADDIERDLL